MIVSDCKPLVQVIIGQVSPSSSTLLPPLHRVTANIVRMFDIGMRPHVQHLDPVIWQRLELNKRADFLVNYTMDIGKTWLQALWHASS